MQQMLQCSTIHKEPFAMISQMQDFVAEKTQAINSQVSKLRQESVRSARAAALGSAGSIKSLKAPVRVVARSGVKLSAVSQTAVEELIELQSDMLTAAIAEAALRLERASRADSVVELVRDQFEMIPATRARMASDAERALAILTSAGREVRSVAAHAYERVVDTDVQAPVQRKTRRKAKKVARKTTARARARKAA
jgi:hypothetical protein